MIWFIANTRSAKVLRDDEITSGSVGLEVEFKFSQAWDGLEKVAVFAVNGKRVDVLLNEDRCTVPPEALITPGDCLTVGVYGAKEDGSIVIPTVYASAGKIAEGAEPSGVEPTPQTQPLIDQLLAAAQAARNAADEAERLAQSVRDDAEAGAFDGAPGDDGKSAYALAVENGYTGTEAQWLQSLHGEDAVVDATLSNAGEAADAAETGKVKKRAEYALRFAETLNNGAGIPLDAEWLSGGYGADRPYRVHSKRAVNTEQKELQAAAGYRFYLRIYSSGSYSDSSWYGPDYASRQTYTLPKGADFSVVVSAYPEDTSVTADPDVYGSKITIKNNIGSGGGISPYTSNPAALGTASPGSSNNYARGDHVHPKPSASDIGAAEVLRCTYGTTTSAEVEAAYQAGKIVLVENNSIVFRLTARISTTYHVFAVATSAGTGTVVLNNDAWSTSSKNIPSASNSTPQVLGTAAAGSSSDFSRADHVHPKPTASDIGAIAAPEGGSVGQVLKKTASGTEWANESGGGGGLSSAAKAALIQIARKISYKDDQGQTYFEDLRDAMYTLNSISAVYTSGTTIYTNTPLDDLKANLVVTANYSDNYTETIPDSDYTLSGTLTAGTSTVTVSYSDKTTTFTVEVTQYRQPLYAWDFTQSLVDSIGGLEIVLSNSNGGESLPTRDSSGLHFTAAEQIAATPAISTGYANGYLYEFDISSAVFAGNTSKHKRLFNISSDNLLIYRNAGALQMYRNAWLPFTAQPGQTIPTTLNELSGKTVGLKLGTDKTAYLYIGGVLVGTRANWATNYTGNYQFRFGGNASGTASDGNDIHNLTITGFRIYKEE